MKIIKFLPAIQTAEQYSDLISRSAWHLNILKEYSFEFFYEGDDFSGAEVCCPEGFDTKTQEHVKEFLSRSSFTRLEELSPSICDDASAFIKWQEDNEELNDFLKKNSKCTIYRTDANLVRQEGSFYIQCAFDLTENKDALIEESNRKFKKVLEKLGRYNNAWVLATGPSIENYANHDFSNSLTIACNSTIFDDALVEKTNPRILVFADPIFHFGISEYAGKFREKVVERMGSLDLTIVVPFKYYRLLVSVFPQYKDRIIGVPFIHDRDFNFDLVKDFYVKTTANILTLLLLPVAGTFSNKVNILGCDGRPFEQDNYFWGHGNTVQINDKMKNIQQVHPGFFDIDYNEYYFEHCHTLECLFRTGESQGMTFTHHANSYIPALRDRNSEFKLTSKVENQHCLLIEPDGIGESGHYVNWYNQVIDELHSRNNSIHVFCNKKQDPSLYRASVSRIFSSHSWGISRGDWCFTRSFENHSSFTNFFKQLEDGIREHCKREQVEQLSLFMYYGSVQILSGLHKVRSTLKKEGISLSISLCLFHESVILSDNIKEPRLPPQARTILLEGLAQADSYRIASVTKDLKYNLYKRIGVQTEVMPNPIPAGQFEGTLAKKKESTNCRVLFPCALRDEKGSKQVEQLLNDVQSGEVKLQGIEIVCRKPANLTQDKISNVSWVPDNLSEQEYRMLLVSAEIIVIPYLAPQFSYRTSGIIVDAMYAGKPIIVMEDTWLAAEVRKYHCGLGVKYFSSHSFATAIEVVRSNLTFLNTHASRSFGKYQLDNSWMKLVEVMFDRK